MKTISTTLHREVMDVISAYIIEYPARRGHPAGAPHSPERIEQERRVELEINACDLLKLLRAQ